VSGLPSVSASVCVPAGRDEVVAMTAL
jgi:hypothetical protein